MTDLWLSEEQIEKQLACHIPHLEKRWSWTLERRLEKHILIHLHRVSVDPSYTVPVIVSQDGSISAWDLDVWDRFWDLSSQDMDRPEKTSVALSTWLSDFCDAFSLLVEGERLSIVGDFDDILDIFRLLQPYRSVLQSVADLERWTVREEKRPVLSNYSTAIGPPVHLMDGDEQQACFWAIDYRFGNLEEWLLVQDEARLRIEAEVKEDRLILPLLGF